MTPNPGRHAAIAILVLLGASGARVALPLHAHAQGESTGSSQRSVTFGNGSASQIAVIAAVQDRPDTFSVTFADPTVVDAGGVAFSLFRGNPTRAHTEVRVAVSGPGVQASAETVAGATRSALDEPRIVRVVKGQIEVDVAPPPESDGQLWAQFAAFGAGGGGRTLPVPLADLRGTNPTSSGDVGSVSTTGEALAVPAGPKLHRDLNAVDLVYDKVPPRELDGQPVLRVVEVLTVRPEGALDPSSFQIRIDLFAGDMRAFRTGSETPLPAKDAPAPSNSVAWHTPIDPVAVGSHLRVTRGQLQSAFGVALTPRSTISAGRSLRLADGQTVNAFGVQIELSGWPTTFIETATPPSTAVTAGTGVTGVDDLTSGERALAIGALVLAGILTVVGLAAGVRLRDTRWYRRKASKRRARREARSARHP